MKCTYSQVDLDERRKPGRRTDLVNDPAVNARREQALAKLKAVK